jgi:hypothetical protein
MHYGALVILPGCYTGDISEAVEKMMAPYDESLEIELSPIDPEYPDEPQYMHNPRSFWDWWQIGGRWTGYLSDYDPHLDPANVETCLICHGSGMRNDALGRNARAANPDHTCNGCDGKGAHVSWPTQWQSHPGDIQRWSAVKEQILSGDKSFYTVLAGEQVAHKEIYVPDAPQCDRFQPATDVETLLATVPDDAICVVVDYHS